LPPTLVVKMVVTSDSLPRRSKRSLHCLLVEVQTNEKTPKCPDFHAW